MCRSCSSSSVAIDAQRIEVDRRGTISNDGVTHGWIELPRTIGEHHGATVDVRIDPGRPFDKPRGVTGRDDSKIAHRSVRACLEGRKQLLMNVVEAAVRHDDDQITWRASFADGANDVGDLGDVARVDACSFRSVTRASAERRSVRAA